MNKQTRKIILPVKGYRDESEVIPQGHISVDFDADRKAVLYLADGTALTRTIGFQRS